MIDSSQRKLIKFGLDFFPTMSYVRWTLEDANELSKCLLNLIKFSDGEFFAYLPESANPTAIHKFRQGGICSPIYLEISILLFEMMKKNNNFSCVIDDVLRNSTDKNIVPYAGIKMFCKD